MATGLLAFQIIARHGYAIERLKRDMLAEPDNDDLPRFLANDAANFVYGYLLATGNRVLPTDRKLRDDLTEAIIATLANHGITAGSFAVWPEIPGTGPHSL